MKTPTQIAKIEHIPEPTPPATKDAPRPDELEVGMWFWVKDAESDEGDWLGCLTELGSNYGLLVEPAREHRSGQDIRLHFDEFFDHCTWVPNAQETIDRYIAHHHSNLNALMGRMQAVTAALGVAPSRELKASTADAQALSTSLSGKSYGDYRAELVKAKKEELPAIFEAIEAEHEHLAKWMSASLLPLRAQVSDLNTITDKIESRIFNVELYAGLVEEIVQVRDGEPAPLETPLTLLQRRHYMDEELLARYQTGGVNFRHIKEFDAWLAKPKNLSRLLPFPRCMLAFRVRRYDVHRECHNFSDYVQLWLENEQNRRTYLYIRNGDRLYRMCTEIDFGSQLFPDMKREILSGKKLWANLINENIRYIISDDDYQERLRLEEEHRQKTIRRYHELKAAPCTCERAKEITKYCDACYQLNSCFSRNHKRTKSLEEYLRDCIHKDYSSYTPFDKTSVYYDDINKYFKKQIEAHNRIALVVQGLLDRSPTLHPHPPWQIWTPEGYEQAIRLVYDSDYALTTGAAPDFGAYRKELNESLCAGCTTIGQRDVWQKRRKEEREDRERHWDGDQGPPELAIVQGFSRRKNTCTYEWTRKSQRGKWVPNPDRPGWRKYIRTEIRVRMEVDANEVICVNAYKPGDFKRFFDDPRTRASYLQWAPMLLAAEEWHAGNKTGVPERKRGE